MFGYAMEYQNCTQYHRCMQTAMMTESDQSEDPVRPTTPEQTWLADYAARGYGVLRGLLPPARCAALAADVQAVLAARNEPDSFLAQSGEFLAGSPIHHLVGSASLRRLVEGILGGAAHLYMGFTAVKGPRQGEFTFHQDGQYTPFDGPGLNCWFALVDCTIANGCLRMVPGTHRQGFAPWREAEQCPGHRTLVDQPTTWDEVEMRAGDCCIFDRATVHGSGPNRTSGPRLAYAVQFHRHDTKAFFDGAWELLTVRPRWNTAPVAAFTDRAGKGE